jgi:hypothetical protein
MRYWVAAVAGSVTWLGLIVVLGPVALRDWPAAMFTSGIGVGAGLVAAFVYNMCQDDE